MSQDSPYKMPPTDTSRLSLVMWAQFGFFALIVYEFYQASDGKMDSSNSVFIGSVLVAGLLQLLRVDNGRMIGMLLLIVGTVVAWGVIDGNMGEAIGALIFFILPFFGMVIFLPALGFDEYGIELSRESRKTLIVAVMALCMSLFTVMDNIDLATNDDGSHTVEDIDGEVTYEVSDLNVNLAKASVGLALFGVVIFLAITLGGMDIGGMSPWHAIAIALISPWVDAYNWNDFGQDTILMGALWALAITATFLLVAQEFFENDTGHEEE